MLSVIMCVHNGELTLQSSLDDLVSAEPDAEIIVVDDGSTDNTPKILNQYSNIKRVNLPTNMGLLRARMEGYKVSTGDWIAFLDSDDHISLGYYSTLANHAVDEDMVLGNVMFLNRPSETGFDRLRPDAPFDSFIRTEGRYLCTTWVWDKVYRRDLFQKVYGVFKEWDVHTYGEDLMISVIAWYHCRKMSVCPDGYVYYSGMHPSEDSVEYVRDMSGVFRFLDGWFKDKNLRWGQNVHLRNFICTHISAICLMLRKRNRWDLITDLRNEWHIQPSELDMPRLIC